jgi:L-aminopeptidase/D-esterase-like protein
MNYSGSITDVAGITVGHHTDVTNGTGCTVVLSEREAVAGIEVRGAAPGSRDTELLHPLAGAEWVNGITLTGGSVFGLDSSGGVIKYLEEQGVGIKMGRIRIPLVPAAVIFDLGFINHRVRPTLEDGYAAAKSASVGFEVGSVGAGTGATAAKLLGQPKSIKGGVGTASVTTSTGATVGALVVVNAIGDIVDPETGEIVAGPQTETGFANSVDLMISSPPKERGFFRNTTIGVVATDAKLNKIGATRLAMAGQDAMAMAVRPSHTANDGDTIFGLSTGTHEEHVPGDVLHAAALKAMTGAILNAIDSAETLGGVLSAADAKAEQR